MSIRVRCPSCRKLLGIADRKAGMVVSCPACGSDINVPAARDRSPREAGDADPDAPPASRAESWFSHPVGVEVEDQAWPERTEPQLATPVPPRPPIQPRQFDDDGGIPVRGGRAEVEEMDLTPMVDMTFLLLIFFMITASFSLNKTIQVPVPDPDEKGQVESPQERDDLLDRSVRVEIDAENVIRIDDEVVADRSVMAETIREKSQGNQRNELILIPDRLARLELVVAVVDAAYAAGMQKIRLSSARVNVE